MTNIENAENAEQYTCKICNFKCSKNSNYIKHISTDKHERLTNPNTKMPKTYSCGCGKQYKHMSSLCKHKTKCNNYQTQTEEEESTFQPLSTETTLDTKMVVELLKDNQELRSLLIEQNKTMMELAKNAGNITNNTTNNTTNNNKFNLNVFLNETCKDAITMNEFINSIEVTMEDFIRTGEIGFVDGISTVMVERIKGMDMHIRPMHCTDLKRETMYIKNDNSWEKGDTDKTLLRRAVKNVANKNYRQLKSWFDSSQPEVDQIGTDEYENYFQYYKAALGGYGKEEDRKFEDKIIKNVLKEVVVDKQ